MEDIKDLAISINTIWVGLAAMLVFFMQAGFGMVEAGLIRAKNACNILAKNFLDFCMATIGYFAVGYALMFGELGNQLIGSGYFFLGGIPELTGDVPTLVFWFFQATFCGAAATIVAGSMAERMKFSAYIYYSIILSAVIYPVVGHWVWGGGWLAELGFLDFAGSTVVHATGGFAALAGMIVIGPRLKKYIGSSVNSITGHNIPLVALGVFILWFGWFGFNAGSTLLGTDYNSIALILANTNIAAAAAGISATFIVWQKFGKPDLSVAMNGALAGLVAITAPCAFVSPLDSLIIGAFAGLLVVIAILVLDKLMIDDPVGAFPVHGVNGIWGTIAVGLFHSEQGLLHGASLELLKIQSLGTFVCSIFVFITMFLIFKIIDYLVGLRVSRQDELLGLDITEHGLHSYSGFQIGVM